jgi:flagellar basal-body rod protein FlgC
MSSMWSAVDIAGSGANVDQAWIDTISGNVANMNDAVTPGQPVYRPEYLVVGEQAGSGSSTSPVPGAGVQVESIELGSSTGEIENDPTNPVANAQGNVEYPAVDLGTEMTDLVNAQTSYQANAEVMSHATDAYDAILDIKA